MSSDTPRDGINLGKIQLAGGSPPLSARLREALVTCTKSLEAGDYSESDKAVSTVVDLLDSIVESPPPDADGAVSMEAASEEALTDIQRFLSSPTSNQMAVDALSLSLPRVVVKFAVVSDKCREMVEQILDCLVSSCNPRDMLSILCEALDSSIKVSKAPIYFVVLLSRLSKVLLCIKRRHAEQVKMSLPIVLNVVCAISSESDEEDKASLADLFSVAITIATSIQSICQKMVGTNKEELNAILGLYVLQNMALVSRSNLADKVSSCTLLVLELSQFLPFCGLSYLGLITGCDVDALIDAIHGDGDDFMASFSFIKDGASLAVTWGFISAEVSKAAEEQLVTVLDKLRRNQTKRWQAVGMLRYVFSIDYPWKIKAHNVELLLSLMDGINPEESSDEHRDCSSLITGFFATLQALQRVIICSSDVTLRKKAFAAFRKVISDLPSSERFDMLKALITNSNSPSMIAILIDLVKEEVLTENRQRISLSDDEIMHAESRPLTISQSWISNALELVELVLKPPKGGPPSLPEHSEPVLSALNLYRFILIMESTGKANQTGMLSESSLRKAYTEWLLPLRTLVSGIEAENRKDNSEFAFDALCGLNPVLLVLYRCIELVEDNLKNTK